MVPSRNIDIIDAIGLAYSLSVLSLERTTDTYTDIHAHTHAWACTYEKKKKASIGQFVTIVCCFTLSL